MKKILLLVMSFLALQSMRADDYTYLIIQNTDGTGVTLDVDNLTMTFSDGYLVAGDTQLSLSDLYKMYFSNDEYDNSVTYEIITIGEAGQATYCSDESLNLKTVTSLKAYVATGYDKTSGTIWLTRVYDVPAKTGVLLIGDAGTYKVPVKANGSTSYYKNMMKGTLEEMTLQTTDGDYTNYYLSNGNSGVGFYKVTATDGVSLDANRAYLSLPTEITASGEAGSTETISVSSAGQVPYYTSQSLDFSDMTDVKAYTATGYDYSTGTIWLTRVKKVPAETGILIIAPEGEYPIPTASVASIYANMFKGSLTASIIYTSETVDDVECTNYYLSDGNSGVGFYKVTNSDGVSLNANRCYLPIPNQSSSTAGTRGMDASPVQAATSVSDDVIALRLFGSADGTSGISASLTDNGEMMKDKDVWYNLQGQRVDVPTKGVYIRNGKKILVK